jgi:hypothetical protein
VAILFKHLIFNAKSSNMATMFLLGLFIFQGIFTQPVMAQNKKNNQVLPQDTSLARVHSPRKASIYSAVLPGLGQAYNHKYWKIPIIYAGFGALAYFIGVNHSEYIKFKDAYIWNVSGDTTPPPNDYAVKYQSADQLKSGRDYYLRNFELSCILTGAWYILNILDASVDAHLINYDINDNLALKLEPALLNQAAYAQRPVAGITLTLKFR